MKNKKQDAAQLGLFDANQRATLSLEDSGCFQKADGNNVVPSTPKKKVAKQREGQQRRHRVRLRKAADAGQSDP
ncbi:MAG: hypothetical protein WA741_15540 [Candidatus Sulfotelmatobacter sp.]